MQSLKRIYGKQIDVEADIEEKLFREIWKTLNKAASEGFGMSGTVNQDDEFLDAIRRNNAVFSAFKTHRMQNDIAAQLLDVDGKLKAFEQFRQDTAGIVDHQVHNWLRTEYDTAVKRAHHAADWRQFYREADILPNLEWLESTSITPGEDHMKFWGLILPIGHSFWTKHRPGDRWGCKCRLRNTDAERTPESDIPWDNRDNEPSVGLENDPGRTGKIFADDHPYIEYAYKGAKAAVKKFLQEIGQFPEEIREKTFKSGGAIQLPEGFRQHAQEQQKNLKAYTELAKLHGEQYKLLTVKNLHGHKNPDAMNMKTGYTSDMKSPRTESGKNAIQASIKSASKQQVQEVFIYLEKEYPKTEIYRGLMASLQGNRAARLKVVIIRFPDGTLKRYNVEQLRKILK